MSRKLLKSVREYKKQAILAPVLVTLEVLLEVLIPLLMANIIDIGIMQGDMNLHHQDGAAPRPHGHGVPGLRREGRTGGGGGGSRLCQEPAPRYLLQNTGFFHLETLTISPRPAL